MDRRRAASSPALWRLPVAVLAAGAAVVLPAPAVQAETVNVTAANLAFAPASVIVQLTANEPGFDAPHAHVIWTMADPGTEHTVTFDDPRLVSSGRLADGQRHEAVLPMAGTFAYRCTIHPTMAGTVVVAPAPPQVPTSAASPVPPTNATVRASAPDPIPDPVSGTGSGAGAAPVGIGAVVLAGLAGLLWLLLRGRRRALPGPPD